MTAVDFGACIKTHRRERGFSQEKLARIMEVSRETVRAIESGENWPSVPTLLKLGEALDIEPAELLRLAASASIDSGAVSSSVFRPGTTWRIITGGAVPVLRLVDEVA